MNFWDEIEIRLPLLNCLNILEYIWWLLDTGYLADLSSELYIIIFNNFQ